MSATPRLPEPTPFSSLIGGTQALATTSGISAVIAGSTGMMNYLTGFDVLVGAAASQTVIGFTVVGLAGSVSTLAFAVQVPAGGATTASMGGLSVTFPQPLPASAVGGSIGATLAAAGAGNANASISLYGFRN